jgi:hypothetical protein
MTFSCRSCNREFECDSPIHFHACNRTDSGDTVTQRLRRSPIDREQRNALWYGLADAVDPDSILRR